MATVKILIAILFFTNAIISANGLDVIPIPRVLEKLSNFYRDRIVFTAPGLFYGTCDQSEPTVDELRCSLALETGNSMKNIYEHLLLCNVTLHSSESRGKIGRDFEFHALKGEKGLLKWSNEQDKDRYAIVDLSNCSVVYPKIDDFDIQSSRVAGANNNTIDIIVRNSKGSQCRTTVCKLTLDLDGNIVETMKEWLKTRYDFIALMKSPTKGYLAVHYTGSPNRTLRIYAINSNGETDIIKEFPANDDTMEKAIELSLTYDLLTACYVIESNITCAQFDLNGILKFEKIISPSYRLHSYKVHNLRDGGFIVINTDCLEREIEKCIADYRKSYYWYLDADGEFVGYIGIGMFICPGGGFTMDTQHFHMNEKGEYCFSDLCPNVRYDKQLMIQNVCLSRLDFEQ